jgi:hypothetical protein
MMEKFKEEIRNSEETKESKILYEKLQIYKGSLDEKKIKNLSKILSNKTNLKKYYFEKFNNIFEEEEEEEENKEKNEKNKNKKNENENKKNKIKEIIDMKYIKEYKKKENKKKPKKEQIKVQFVISQLKEMNFFEKYSQELLTKLYLSPFGYLEKDLPYFLTNNFFKRYGTFHTSIIIGPYKFEYLFNGVCKPKPEIGSKNPLICLNLLTIESNNQLMDIYDKVSDVIIDWNVYE